MSLENEYYSWKQMVAREEKSLAEFKAAEIVEDENNPFSVEERLQAKEKGIASCKENIKEYEEILEEIKEELIKFINNGGEVSEKTKEEIGYFESFRVNFKIIFNKNEQVYVEGYVTINDENAEDVDWYFWKGTEYITRRYIHHGGISITGATAEQENELAQFESDLSDEGIWIDDVILQSDENENRTHVRKNFTLIINEGAKIECKVTESTQYDYWANIEITFNGKNIVNIIDDDLLDELAEEIDSIYGEEGHYEWVNGCLLREVSKYHFNEDDYYKEERKEIENEYINIARDKLAKTFSRRLSIFTKYGENAEQLFEECDISDIALVTDGNLHQFLIDEGIIDE